MARKPGPKEKTLPKREARLLLKDYCVTTLQPGDSMCWHQEDGTLSFGRPLEGSSNFLIFGGEKSSTEHNPHPFRVDNRAAFFFLADLIAALHGFDLEIESQQKVSFLKKGVTDRGKILVSLGP